MPPPRSNLEIIPQAVRIRTSRIGMGVMLIWRRLVRAPFRNRACRLVELPVARRAVMEIDGEKFAGKSLASL